MNKNRKRKKLTEVVYVASVWESLRLGWSLEVNFNLLGVPLKVINCMSFDLGDWVSDL
jgi:hypothetical protein